jgi:Nickel/cobalt transporter regulator
MKQMFLGALIAATFLTPAAQAAESPYIKGQPAAANVGGGDVADYRRGGDGRGGSAQGQSQGQNSGNRQPSPRSSDDRGGSDRRGHQGNRSTDNSGNWQSQPQPQPRVAEPRNDGRWRGQANTGDNRGSAYGGQDRVDQNRSDRDSNRGWRSGSSQSTDQRDDHRRENDGWDRDRNGRSDNRSWDRDRNGRSDNRSWDNGRRDDNRNRRDDDRRWDNGWRNDQRYNWRNHRERNRSHYSIGRYYSPDRHHSYRRFNIGFYIGTPFYHDRYWIDDPWSYRLPDVYGPYRWVRYYDDVLLIDLRNGYVVDVLHDLLW